MRRKLELLKLQIKSAFLSIPKIILGTIVTAVDIQKQILKKAGIHNFKLTNP